MNIDRWKLMFGFRTKCGLFSDNLFRLFTVFEQDIHTTQEKYQTGVTQIFVE